MSKKTNTVILSPAKDLRANIIDPSQAQDDSRVVQDDSRVVIYYDKLESTQNTAKDLAHDGAAHGTAVVANHQTAGRGRRGRSFYSPGGAGIYMSIIINPDKLGLNDPALITIHTAVAVRDAIEMLTGKKPGIKWVNDLFLDNKKICGILVEATDGIMIVGIGINFSMPANGFGDELSQIAGALYTGEAPATSRQALTRQVQKNMLAPNPGALAEYKSHMMMLGAWIIVKDPAGDYIARAMDINDKGHLIVQKDSGQIATLIAGDISIIPYR